MYCLPGVRFIEEKIISSLISVVIELFPVKDKFSLNCTMVCSWLWLDLIQYELNAWNTTFLSVQRDAHGILRVKKLYLNSV